MSRRCLTVFCAFAGLLPAGWARAQQPDRPALPGGPAGRPVRVVRTEWEYRTISRAQLEKLVGDNANDPFTAGLDKLGAEGWELVAVAPPDSGRPPLFVFKRPASRTGRGWPTASAEPPQAPGGAPNAGAADIRVFRLKNARAADTEQILAKMIGRRGPVGPRFASDERTNSVLVSGTPQQVAEVEAVLNRLDTPQGAKAAPGGK